MNNKFSEIYIEKNNNSQKGSNQNMNFLHIEDLRVVLKNILIRMKVLMKLS